MQCLNQKTIKTGEGRKSPAGYVSPRRGDFSKAEDFAFKRLKTKNYFFFLPSSFFGQHPIINLLYFNKTQINLIPFGDG